LGIGFHSYEGLAFRNTSGLSQAIFVGNQFGAGLISTSLHVTGVNGTNQNIFVVDVVNFSAAHWSFTNWQLGDVLHIDGNSGNNTIVGSSRADNIDGGSGADILLGGAGADVFSGGDGNDIFRFNRTTDSSKGKVHDAIFDFAQIEGDRIDVHKIDANTLVGGNQNFHFIGAKHFHHKAGELHFVKHQSPGFAIVTVEGDVNGDGRPDFRIDVTNDTHDLASLVRGDFVL
jgi:Ca2+-binding RTX toxin-like protein